MLTDAAERLLFAARAEALLARIRCTATLRYTDLPTVTQRAVVAWAARTGLGAAAPAVAAVAALPHLHKLEVQFLKKVLGALHFGFARFLLLDSEATVLKPTSFTRLFDDWFAAPAYFVSVNKMQAEKWPLTPGIAYSLLTGARWEAAGIGRVWEEMGWPVDTWFIDVQHWFHRRAWLQAFVAHVEATWRLPLAAALGRVSGHPMEVPAILGYYMAAPLGQKALAGEFTFVDTQRQLKAYGLGKTDAPWGRETWGTGEVLFLKLHRAAYGRFKAMVVDAAHPVHFFRDQAHAGLALHSMDGQLHQINSIAHRNYLFRLVCESPRLNMSVCYNPPPALGTFDWGRCLRGDYAALAPL